ncbi:MAG: hypothetical protein RL291_1170 [Pseudomonadota bacterium]
MSTPKHGPFETVERLALYPDADGRVLIDNAALMFRGTYTRAGSDLIISGGRGESVIIPEYFASDGLATLVSAGGATLPGDIVSRLAGPRFPMQYAQAAPPSGTVAPSSTQAIGQVENIEGSATVQRTSGQTDTLAVGSPLYQGDVVQTAAGGRVSLTFADRTILTVSESARMVLDQFVYNPGAAPAGGAGNALNFNLVQGAFVFISGQVAPTGEMKLETPVATMGIRGTSGIVRIVANDGVTTYTLVRDPNGSLGAFDLLNKQTGAVLRALRAENESVTVNNIAGDLFEVFKTPAEIQADQAIFAFAVAASVALGARTSGGEPVINPNLGPPGGPPGGPGPTVPPVTPQAPGTPDQPAPAQPPPPLERRGDIGDPSVIRVADIATGSLDPITSTGGTLEPIGGVRVVTLVAATDFGTPNTIPLLPDTTFGGGIDTPIELPGATTSPLLPTIFGPPVFTTTPISLTFGQSGGPIFATGHLTSHR